MMDNNEKLMEQLKEELINLIEIKGILSEEVIKVSTDLDKLIVEYYKQAISTKNRSRIDE